MGKSQRSCHGKAEVSEFPAEWTTEWSNLIACVLHGVPVYFNLVLWARNRPVGIAEE